jgi:putative aldouronate transport system substrate-binding protein
MSRKHLFLSILVFTLTTGILSAGGSQAKSGASDSGLDKPIPFTMAVSIYSALDEHPKMIEYWNKMFNLDIQILNIDSNQYEAQLNLKFAANEIPDFYKANLNNLQKYYEQQVMAEIPANMLTGNMPDINRQFNAVAPDYIKYGKINGKIFMIPSSLGYNTAIRQPVVYRGDWISAVGKKGAPTTLAELESLLYAFANNDPDKNGRKDTYGISSSAFNMVYGAYGYIPKQWNKKGNELVYSSIQPEIKESLAVLAKWYKDGIIDPEFITGENKGGYWALSHSFIQGRIGLSCHGAYYHWNHFTWDASQDYIELMAINPTAAESLVFGEPVKGPLGKGVLWMANPVQSSSLAFGVQVEKQPEKMARILKWQNYFFENSENYLTGYYGIKGEDWNFNENGAPAPNPGNDFTRLGSMGAHLASIQFTGPKTNEIVYPWRGSWLEENNFYSNGVWSELITGQPSAGIYQTELTKIEDEAFIAIITGERPLSYFDEFVALWKRGGGDVLTKEANDWWKSVN